MKLLFAAGALLAVCAPLRAQSGMPAWLAVYPGASATTRATGSRIIASYTAAAPPEDVREHYRKLFEARGLPFVPVADGSSIIIQGSVECDLAIAIHPLAAGATVQVSCTERASDSGVVVLGGGGAAATSNDGPSYRSITTTQATPNRTVTMTDAQAHALERHKEFAAAMAMRRQHVDLPAPPLVWPRWLTGIDGGALNPQRATDQSRNELLKVEYRSSAPMTRIFAFYKDLLTANGYPVTGSKLGTGSTSTGIQQNADGYVDGANYPDGNPGPRTEIRVSFSRMYLNEPIRVLIRVTAHDYHGLKTQAP